MRFIVTSEGNHSTFGDIFFEVPTEETLIKAEKAVWDLGTDTLSQYVGEQDKLWQRFETEFRKMCITKTAFHFILLMEIAQISLEEGYPVDILGDAAGSVIAYLLGITGQDTLPYYINYCAEELLWGLESTPEPLDFSLGIAAEIRPLIHEKLERKYGSWRSRSDCYRRISLTDLAWCQSLGKLAKLTNRKPTLEDCSNEVFCRVLKNLAKAYEGIEGFERDEEAYGYRLEDISYVSDFDELIRIFAYENGVFGHKKVLSNLQIPDFFVTKDELFSFLIHHGVPRELAADAVKARGFFDRRDHVKILENYSLPLEIYDWYMEGDYLWSGAECISRLVFLCYEAWYQIEVARRRVSSCQSPK